MFRNPNKRCVIPNKKNRFCEFIIRQLNRQLKATADWSSINFQFFTILLQNWKKQEIWHLLSIQM